MNRKQPKTHTVPNMLTIRGVHSTPTGVRWMQCCIVSRGKEELAVYPAEWTNGRIPSMSEVQRDARWH